MIQSVYRGLLLAAAVATAAGCGSLVTADPVRVSATEHLMGVAWTITLYAPERAAGEAAIAAGFAEARRLERILSDYDPASELSRLSASAPTTTPVAIGDDLWAVLVRADEFRVATDGAFDVTVGPLTTLWRQARRSGRMPRADKFAAARDAVGGDSLVLDLAARTASLRRPGMRLDLGGIGMGYAADRVMAVLAARGIESALVDASGDVLVSAPPPGRAGWLITVAGLGHDGDAAEPLVLAHAAVTTSGDARQAVEIDGRRYSHVVDPRTGLGVAGPAAVSVIAADGITADAVATAASVAGHEAGPALVGRFPGVGARFLWHDGDTTKTAVTAGWPSR
ncbi:MAG: FAD:protein FMN transferase [Pirellulales bacterium]